MDTGQDDPTGLPASAASLYRAALGPAGASAYLPVIARFEERGRSAAVLFGGAAVVLGARPVWRAIAFGVALALLVQVIFAGILDVSLPPGPLFEGVSILGG